MFNWKLLWSKQAAMFEVSWKYGTVFQVSHTSPSLSPYLASDKARSHQPWYSTLSLPSALLIGEWRRELQTYILRESSV